jgi:hypothetical protein
MPTAFANSQIPITPTDQRPIVRRIEGFPILFVRSSEFSLSGSFRWKNLFLERFTSDHFCFLLNRTCAVSTAKT